MNVRKESRDIACFPYMFPNTLQLLDLVFSMFHELPNNQNPSDVFWKAIRHLYGLALESPIFQLLLWKFLMFPIHLHHHVSFATPPYCTSPFSAYLPLAYSLLLNANRHANRIYWFFFAHPNAFFQREHFLCHIPIQSASFAAKPNLQSFLPPRRELLSSRPLLDFFFFFSYHLLNKPSTPWQHTNTYTPARLLPILIFSRLLFKISFLF